MEPSRPNDEPSAVDQTRRAYAVLPKWTAALLLVGWCAVSVAAAMAVIDLEDARATAARFQSTDRRLTAITDTVEAVLAAAEGPLDSVATGRAREILDSARVLRRQIGGGPDLQAAETARTRSIVSAGTLTVAVAAYFLWLFMAGHEKRRQRPS